jgi:hypothetical protein
MATKRTYAENLALAATRVGAAPKAVKKAPAAKQLSLPMWPDAAIGIPNSLLRGALFGVSTERKVHQKRTLLTSVDGYEIRFKGETFNQTDLDVTSKLLDIAQPHPLGKRVEFTAHALLKELGRGTGGKDHEQLKEEIARLMGGVVEISDASGKKTYMGTLVHDAGIDDATGRWEVVFNNRMLNLYEDGYTLIDQEQRQLLGRNNLAKWLHGQYATHAKPFPYKVETIRNLCGSTTKRLGDFRKLLRIALAQLEDVGAIKSWTIDPKTDLVEVVNVPSQAQLKHLTKAAKRPVKRKI